MAAHQVRTGVRCALKIIVKDRPPTVKKTSLLTSSLSGKSSSCWRTFCSSSSLRSSDSPLEAGICGSGDVLGHFDRLVQRGSVRRDDQQIYVLQRLAQAQHQLKTYSQKIYLNPPNHSKQAISG